MWIFIWAVLAIIMLGFMGWNMAIMIQQKRSWRALADKYQLSYQSAGMMESPLVTGKLGKSYFSLFSGMLQTDDMRGQRFVTALEFSLGKGFPTGGILATSSMKPFADTLVFDETYTPDIEGWQDDYVLRARDEDAMRAYLTPERLVILCRMFKIKGATVMFLFDQYEGVLRIETSDPLRNPERLGRITTQLIEAVDILTPTVEEKRKFALLLRDEEKRQEEKARKKLEYDPDLDMNALALELEDDGTVSSLSLEIEDDAAGAVVSADKEAAAAMVAAEETPLKTAKTQKTAKPAAPAAKSSKGSASKASRKASSSSKGTKA